MIVDLRKRKAKMYKENVKENLTVINITIKYQ